MTQKTYKIKIWQYHCLVDTYENNDVKEILEWYKEHWLWTYENGGCAFYVYENDRELTFDEEYKLGFYEEE